MDKGEIKAATVHELGCKFEDMLEASKQDESRNEGAKMALLVASKKVTELTLHVDKDLDEGAFGDVNGPLAVAALSAPPRNPRPRSTCGHTHSSSSSCARS